jgi:hypothetical protein
MRTDKHDEGNRCLSQFLGTHLKTEFFCWNKNLYIQDYLLAVLISTLKMETLYLRNVYNTVHVHSVQRPKIRMNISEPSRKPKAAGSSVFVLPLFLFLLFI